MPRILVVDDNAKNCELVVESLTDIVQCDVAVSGEEALVAYNKKIESSDPYALILLDIAMPGIDGIDVLKAIRVKEELRGVRLGYGTPVIMVTAYKEPFRNAFNNGCDDYILKPIDPDALVEKVKEKLNKMTS